MYLCIYRKSVDAISYFKYNKQGNYIETITDIAEKNRLLSLDTYYYHKHARHAPSPVIIIKLRNMQTGDLRYCNIIFADNFIVNGANVIPMFIFNSRFKYPLSTMNNCKKSFLELTQVESRYINNIYDIDYISYIIIYNTFMYEHKCYEGNTQEDTQGNTQEDTQGNTQEDTQGNTQEDTQGNTQEDTQEEDLCPILLTPLNKNNYVILNECNHRFSINGLTEYLSRSIRNKCPLCRKQINIHYYIEKYIANNTVNITG